MNEHRGVKRLCATCGTRFYDLLTKPVCPKCKAEFIIPVPPPPRRPRPIPQAFMPPPVAANSTEDIPENDDDETIAPESEEADDAKEQSETDTADEF